MFHVVESVGMSELLQALIDPVSNLLALEKWTREIGKTSTTIWRWRKHGWIRTVNICGRVYISREEISRFEKRAAAGEFSKTHVTPKQKGADQ
jgi:hypothetical protein